MLPKSRFSKPIFGRSAGSTKLDRPYCKRFWQLRMIRANRFARIALRIAHATKILNIFWGYFVETILWGKKYRSSKWHYRQRKIIFELIMHFIADTDTDIIYFGIIFCSRCRHSCSLQFWGGRIADRNCFGIIFYFITDTDTEKYYFRIISALNSDKRYPFKTSTNLHLSGLF